jgi:hypothetical protein
MPERFRGKVIRIDQRVWEHLKRHAQPLSDTPNTVLLRLLGLSDTSDGIPKVKQRKKDKPHA